MLLAYEKMVKEIAVALGADPAVAEQDAKELVDFEIELANVSVAIMNLLLENFDFFFEHVRSKHTWWVHVRADLTEAVLTSTHNVCFG